MKLDATWPAPPPFSSMKKGDQVAVTEIAQAVLPPKRAFAVERLRALADLAELDIVPLDGDGDPVMLPEDRAYRTPEDFVKTILERWLSSGPVVGPALPLPVWRDMLAGQEEAAAEAKQNGKLLIKWAVINEDQIMLIPMRTHGHLMSPIRGDIVVMHDGHSGIVTAPQCSGCRHFEMAEFTPRGIDLVPTVRVQRHWLSTVSHLIRIVQPKPQPQPQPQEQAAPVPAAAVEDGEGKAPTAKRGVAAKVVTALAVIAMCLGLSSCQTTADPFDGMINAVGVQMFSEDMPATRAIQPFQP